MPIQPSRKLGIDEFEKEVLDRFRPGNDNRLGALHRRMDGFSRFYFSEEGTEKGMYVDLVPGYRQSFGGERYSTFEVRTDKGSSGWIVGGQLQAGHDEERFVNPLDALATAVSNTFRQRPDQKKGASYSKGFINNLQRGIDGKVAGSPVQNVYSTTSEASAHKGHSQVSVVYDRGVSPVEADARLLDQAFSANTPLTGYMLDKDTYGESTRLVPYGMAVHGDQVLLARDNYRKAQKVKAGERERMALLRPDGSVSQPLPPTDASVLGNVGIPTTQRHRQSNLIFENETQQRHGILSSMLIAPVPFASGSAYTYGKAKNNWGYRTAFDKDTIDVEGFVNRDGEKLDFAQLYQGKLTIDDQRLRDRAADGKTLRANSTFRVGSWQHDDDSEAMPIFLKTGNRPVMYRGLVMHTTPGEGEAGAIEPMYGEDVDKAALAKRMGLDPDSFRLEASSAQGIYMTAHTQEVVDASFKSGAKKAGKLTAVGANAPWDMATGEVKSGELQLRTALGTYTNETQRELMGLALGETGRTLGNMQPDGPLNADQLGKDWAALHGDDSLTSYDFYGDMLEGLDAHYRGLDKAGQKAFKDKYDMAFGVRTWVEMGEVSQSQAARQRKIMAESVGEENVGQRLRYEERDGKLYGEFFADNATIMRNLEEFAPEYTGKPPIFNIETMYAMTKRYPELADRLGVDPRMPASATGGENPAIEGWRHAFAAQYYKENPKYVPHLTDDHRASVNKSQAAAALQSISMNVKETTSDMEAFDIAEKAFDEAGIDTSKNLIGFGNTIMESPRQARNIEAFENEVGRSGYGRTYMDALTGSLENVVKEGSDVGFIKAQERLSQKREDVFGKDTPSDLMKKLQGRTVPGATFAKYELSHILEQDEMGFTPKSIEQMVISMGIAGPQRNAAVRDMTKKIRSGNYYTLAARYPQQSASEMAIYKARMMPSEVADTEHPFVAGAFNTRNTGDSDRDPLFSKILTGGWDEQAQAFTELLDKERIAAMAVGNGELEADVINREKFGTDDVNKDVDRDSVADMVAGKQPMSRTFTRKDIAHLQKTISDHETAASNIGVAFNTTRLMLAATSGPLHDDAGLYDTMAAPYNAALDATSANSSAMVNIMRSATFTSGGDLIAKVDADQKGWTHFFPNDSHEMRDTFIRSMVNDLTHPNNERDGLTTAGDVAAHLGTDEYNRAEIKHGLEQAIEGGASSKEITNLLAGSANSAGLVAGGSDFETTPAYKMMMYSAAERTERSIQNPNKENFQRADFADRQLVKGKTLADLRDHKDHKAIGVLNNFLKRVPKGIMNAPANVLHHVSKLGGAVSDFAGTMLEGIIPLEHLAQVDEGPDFMADLQAQFRSDEPDLTPRSPGSHSPVTVNTGLTHQDVDAPAASGSPPPPEEPPPAAAAAPPAQPPQGPPQQPPPPANFEGNPGDYDAQRAGQQPQGQAPTAHDYGPAMAAMSPEMQELQSNYMHAAMAFFQNPTVSNDQRMKELMARVDVNFRSKAVDPMVNRQKIRAAGNVLQGMPAGVAGFNQQVMAAAESTGVDLSSVSREEAIQMALQNDAVGFLSQVPTENIAYMKKAYSSAQQAKSLMINTPVGKLGIDGAEYSETLGKLDDFLSGNSDVGKSLQSFAEIATALDAFKPEIKAAKEGFAELTEASKDIVKEMEGYLELLADEDTKPADRKQYAKGLRTEQLKLQRQQLTDQRESLLSEIGDIQGSAPDDPRRKALPGLQEDLRGVTGDLGNIMGQVSDDRDGYKGSAARKLIGGWGLMYMSHLMGIGMKDVTQGYGETQQAGMQNATQLGSYFGPGAYRPPTTEMEYQAALARSGGFGMMGLRSLATPFLGTPAQTAAGAAKTGVGAAVLSGYVADAFGATISAGAMGLVGGVAGGLYLAGDYASRRTHPDDTARSMYANYVQFDRYEDRDGFFNKMAQGAQGWGYLYNNYILSKDGNNATPFALAQKEGAMAAESVFGGSFMPDFGGMTPEVMAAFVEQGSGYLTDQYSSEVANRALAAYGQYNSRRTSTTFLTGQSTGVTPDDYAAVMATSPNLEKYASSVAAAMGKIPSLQNTLEMSGFMVESNFDTDDKQARFAAGVSAYSELPYMREVARASGRSPEDFYQSVIPTTYDGSLPEQLRVMMAANVTAKAQLGYYGTDEAATRLEDLKTQDLDSLDFNQLKVNLDTEQREATNLAVQQGMTDFFKGMGIDSASAKQTAINFGPSWTMSQRAGMGNTYQQVFGGAEARGFLSADQAAAYTAFGGSMSVGQAGNFANIAQGLMSGDPYTWATHAPGSIPAGVAAPVGMNMSGAPSSVFRPFETSWDMFGNLGQGISASEFAASVVGSTDTGTYAQSMHYNQGGAGTYSSTFLNSWRGVGPSTMINGQSKTMLEAGVDGVTASNGMTYTGDTGVKLWGIQNNYNNQMASIGAQAAQHAASWAFQTGIGLENYAPADPRTGEVFDIQGSGGFWGLQDRQMALSRRQAAWGAQYQRRSMALQWEGYGLQGRSLDIGAQRIELQDHGLDLQRRGLALSERQHEISIERQESSIGFNRAMLGLNRQQTLIQRQGTRDDWVMQDQVRDLQWQWKSEDFDESVRFMSGRQRKLAERQFGRDTVMHNIEGDNVTRQRERQKQIWSLEDKRFRLQEKRQNEEIEHQEELIEIQKQQFELRREQFALTEENLVLNKEQFEIQKEQYELQGEQLELQQENMEKNIAFQNERLSLEQESQELQRAYATVQHELQGSAIGAAIRQAEQAKEIAEQTEIAGVEQKSILDNWSQWQNRWPEEFQEAFAGAIEAVAAKFRAVMSAAAASVRVGVIQGGGASGFTPYIGGNSTNSSGGATLGKKGGDALGGHRMAFEAGEVGEYEPEIFVPEQSGTIIPMHKINPWTNQRIETPAVAKESKAGPTIVKVYIGNEQLDNRIIRVVESELV